MRVVFNNAENTQRMPDHDGYGWVLNNCTGIPKAFKNPPLTGWTFHESDQYFSLLACGASPQAPHQSRYLGLRTFVLLLMVLTRIPP